MVLFQEHHLPHVPITGRGHLDVVDPRRESGGVEQHRVAPRALSGVDQGSHLLAKRIVDAQCDRPVLTHVVSNLRRRVERVRVVLVQHGDR